MNSRNVCILGSTGSIGINTLDVIARHPEQYNVTALTAHTQVERLFQQIQQFTPRTVAVKGEQEAEVLAELCAGMDDCPEILIGEAGNASAASLPENDIVVAGIVGAAGLMPTLAAVRAGKIVLVANKEPLVMLGQAFMREAQSSRAVILPVDSEHNAIFQSLPTEPSKEGGIPTSLKGVKRVLLTGSGGPFRGWSRELMAEATVEQAIAHPNWAMGRKISVDSATMMNKGLELIEACCLFDTGPENIEIVVHPQSIIHSMVEYVDGSVIAQLGNPDMRIPIAHALAWPERIDSGVGSLDLFAAEAFQFMPPDLEKFPCLRLAREAAETGGLLPSIMNAANEIAVDAFLQRQIGFNDIPKVIENTIENTHHGDSVTLESVLEADQQAREVARTHL